MNDADFSPWRRVGKRFRANPDAQSLNHPFWFADSLRKGRFSRRIVTLSLCALVAVGLRIGCVATSLATLAIIAPHHHPSRRARQGRSSRPIIDARGQQLGQRSAMPLAPRCPAWHCPALPSGFRGSRLSRGLQSLERSRTHARGLGGQVALRVGGRASLPSVRRAATVGTDARGVDVATGAPVGQPRRPFFHRVRACVRSDAHGLALAGVVSIMFALLLVGRPALLLCCPASTKPIALDLLPGRAADPVAFDDRPG
jgi:hypothetical protein